MNDDSAIDVPGMLHLDGPPSTGWVVHQVARRAENQHVVWAWCKVQVDEPGYTDITFTKPDGKTPTDPGDGELRLGAVLFQLWC